MIIILGSMSKFSGKKHSSFFHFVEMDADPCLDPALDRQTLDADPDPDPAK
jgi:hypothetical protein